MLIHLQRWYGQYRDRDKGLRAIPFRRMWLLLLGVFLLFFDAGFYGDLLGNGTTPVLAVLSMGCISGFNAVLWIFTVWRLPPACVIVLVVLQFFLGRIVGFVSDTLEHLFHLHRIAPAVGVRFAANGMFWTVILGFSVVMRFITREGGESLVVQDQLELAHAIQRTLVPVLSLRTPHFEIYGFSNPSERVGGDLVDAVLLPSGDVLAYLADIAGHGLPASILMGRLKTAIRTALLHVEDCGDLPMLPLLLERVNTVLPQVKSDNLYATFTGFRLDGEGGVSCAMAASPPVLHWHAYDESLSQTQIPQLPLGLLPVTSFDQHTLDTQAGDLLLVATDGILEVSDKAGVEFGIDRLSATVAANCRDSLPALAEKILFAARGFGPQLDDQTLLLIRRF